jgi:CHASE3 domain sensor protein
MKLQERLRKKMGKWDFSVFRRVRDIPLRVKGLVIILIPLLALFLVVAAFYLVQRENQSAESLVGHTLEVKSEIQLVRTRIEQAQSSVLGYVISGDPLWLERFRVARDVLPTVTSRLEAMVADNPSQEAHARNVHALVQKQLVELEKLRLEARPGPALLERAYGLDAIHNQLDQMQDEESELLAARRAHADQVWNRGYAIIGAAAVITPAGAVLAVLFFFQGIAQRIQLAEANARALAEGRPVAPMRSGGDEIGRLEQSLGEAATLLATRERQLREAAGELESRVEQRTTELAAANEALHAEVGERKRAEMRLAAATARWPSSQWTPRAASEAGTAEPSRSTAGARPKRSIAPSRLRSTAARRHPGAPCPMTAPSSRVSKPSIGARTGSRSRCASGPLLFATTVARSTEKS